MDQNINDSTQSQAQPVATTQPTANSQSDIDFKALENMSNEEFLEALAAGLLAEKNLGEMDDETKTDMIHDLVERMTVFINRSILEALPSDKLNTIEQLSNNNAPIEEINKVIQESGVDVPQITADALEKFQNIYLGPNENAEV